ncbi:hypothetical protein BGZ81_004520 [Podila clonocystis]|nr:hypothetical protein BGZ81_004520 [Podila clonocystis]
MSKTFHGRIEDTLDALVIFEACRQGVLPKLQRRLCAAEKGEIQDLPYELESPLHPATTSTTSPSSSRFSSALSTIAPKASSPPPPPKIHYQSQNLITPGSVFVFDEAETKICRWTDGRIWSPSRICGNFLVYHELYRKLPKQKCRTARDKANVCDGHGLKDKALRDKVEQDGLVVLGSRKGTFVLKKDGLIKKTICVKGIRLTPLDQLQSALSVASKTSTGGRGGGGRQEANSAESRVAEVSFTGTQHLVCYEQAGAMEGLYRPRDYVQLREMCLSKTFVTNQKFRDPVRVKPLPGGEPPVEPSDEYISQTRIVEARIPPKPTVPSTEPATRSTPTTRKGSGPVSRRGGRRSLDAKAATILNHPYPTRGQDRQLLEVLEESQAQGSYGSQSRSASPLSANVDQTNEDCEDASEMTGNNEGRGEPRESSGLNALENTELHLETLEKDQLCESNHQAYDHIMEGPTRQSFGSAKSRKQIARVLEADSWEHILSQSRDQERPYRRVENGATECSSSKTSSPATITTSMSLSSSLSLSPAAVPRDGPGALYSDFLSPTGSTCDSENMDMEEASQTLQRASTKSCFPPRQYSASSNTAYLPPHDEYFGDAPENSIRALLFAPDPMSPNYRYLPPPSNVQEWRYSGDHLYNRPPVEPLAYPEEHRGSSSPPAPGDSPESYVLHPSAQYRMMPRQVLQRQLQDRLQLHQMQEWDRIEYQKRMGYESNDYGSVRNLHSNAISSASTTSGTISEGEGADNRGSWTTGMDLGVNTEQRRIGQELVREHMPDSNPVDSAQVTEWVETDDNNETAVRHESGLVYDIDTANALCGLCPKRVPDWQKHSDSSKEPDYSEQLIERTHPWSSPFGAVSSSKRQRWPSNGEYLTLANYEDLESPPTVDNGARDSREMTSNHATPPIDTSWTPLEPIQIMSHVHITPRRRPNVTMEPAEDDASVNEYLLYSHHQPATFQVVQENTVAAHDEPPSAHLGSEEDPFFSDLRARGIGGRSCLAVHASSSPMQPSSAVDEHDDKPRDGSVKS